MKKDDQTSTSSTTRAFIYLSIFIVGSVVIALLYHFVEFIPRAALSISLTFAILASFASAGAIFACERHMLSRVSSAATLFALGVIALFIGRSFIPDAYLLITALGIAFLGAQPILHRKLATLKQTTLRSVLVIVTALIVGITLATGITIVNRNVVISQQHSLYN